MHETGGVLQLDNYLCFSEQDYVNWVAEPRCRIFIISIGIGYLLHRVNGQILDRAEIRTPNFEQQYLLKFFFKKTHDCA